MNLENSPHVPKNSLEQKFEYFTKKIEEISFRYQNTGSPLEAARMKELKKSDLLPRVDYMTTYTQEYQLIDQAIQRERVAWERQLTDLLLEIITFFDDTSTIENWIKIIPKNVKVEDGSYDHYVRTYILLLGDYFLEFDWRRSQNSYSTGDNAIEVATDYSFIFLNKDRKKLPITSLASMRQAIYRDKETPQKTSIDFYADRKNPIIDIKTREKYEKIAQKIDSLQLRLHDNLQVEKVPYD